MPEVIVKYRPGKPIPPAMRPWFRGPLQDAVAEVLGVPDTQAALRADEVEVDYQVFGPDAATNGFDCAITVTANLYPERAGKEQDYAERLGEQLQNAFPCRGWRCYVWVKLEPAGFKEFHT